MLPLSSTVVRAQKLGVSQLFCVSLGTRRPRSLEQDGRFFSLEGMAPLEARRNRGVGVAVRGAKRSGSSTAWRFFYGRLWNGVILELRGPLGG